MKLALISDIHAEFKSQVLPTLDRDVDVLVLAGDTNSAKRVVETAQAIAAGRAKHIVFVAGNHEYYGTRIDKGKLAMRDTPENMHFLDDDMVTIDNVVFLGGTLWTDYQLYGRDVFDMLRAESYMNDHRRIKFKQGEATYRRFLPKDAQRLHYSTRSFLYDNLRKLALQGNRQTRIVVTHHAPSGKSINAKYQSSDNLNSAYASDLSYMLNDYGPDYWFHGHMHDPVDYMFDHTRVIANPHGYPSERANPSILYMDIDNASED